MRIWVSRKPTFVYRSQWSKVSLLYQRKTSLLLAYIEILRYSNSWQRFVLFSLYCASAFVTNLQRLHVAYVLRHPPERFRLQQLAEVRKRCLYRFKYGYLSYKNTSIRYRGLYSLPGAVMHVLIWMDALYLTTFDLLNTISRPCRYRAWKSQDNFEYNSDWIHLKEESHIHLGCLEGE